MLLRETLLALLVVALTFLNFGHSSAVFAAGGRVVVTASSICGDPGTPPDGAHFTCHACRPDIGALPPPPSAVEPVCFVATRVAYATPFAATETRLPFGLARPRGPPAA